MTASITDPTASGCASAASVASTPSPSATAITPLCGRANESSSRMSALVWFTPLYPYYVTRTIRLRHKPTHRRSRYRVNLS